MQARGRALGGLCRAEGQCPLLRTRASRWSYSSPQAATPPAPSPTLSPVHASVTTPPHPAATPSHPPPNPTPTIALACPRPPRHPNAPLPTNRPAPHHCPLPGMFAPQQAGSVQPLTDARLGSGSREATTQHAFVESHWSTGCQTAHSQDGAARCTSARC